MSDQMDDAAEYWVMWDDDDDEEEDACPGCGFRDPCWEGGICFCEHCGYIGG